MISVSVALAFVPHQLAYAKTCYDASKQPIPCPKSDYQLTQRAKAANPSPTRTLVPPTNTPTPTPSATPVPTPTDSPQAPQSSALVSQPASPGSAAALAGASRSTPPGETQNPLFFPLLLGGGGLLGVLLIGLLIRAQAVGAGSGRGHAARTNSQAEQALGQEERGIQMPKVDMDYAVGDAHLTGDASTTDDSSDSADSPPPDP
jgi:hypothetical protein